MTVLMWDPVTSEKCKMAIPSPPPPPKKKINNNNISNNNK